MIGTVCIIFKVTSENHFLITYYKMRVVFLWGISRIIG